MVYQHQRVRLQLTRQWANVTRYLLGLERGYIYRLRIEIGGDDPISWGIESKIKCDEEEDQPDQLQIGG